jgi:hypothetical protein
MYPLQVSGIDYHKQMYARFGEGSICHLRWVCRNINETPSPCGLAIKNMAVRGTGKIWRR